MALLVSCSSATDLELPDRSTLEGIVVERDRWSSIVGRPTIHLKRDIGEECGVVFEVTGNTTIVRRGDTGNLRRASLEDVRVGSVARIWAVGDAIRRSCPGQGTAEAVELL